MNKLKNITALLIALLLVCSFASCGNRSENTEENSTETETDAEKTKVRVAIPDGPDAVGLAKLISDRDYAFSFSILQSLSEASDMLMNGETDMAVLPVNLAADIYNKTNGGIQIISVNALGSLYVLERGKSIKSLNDLKGKTVYLSDKGSVPEYVFKYILTENGINPDKDLTLEYRSSQGETASLIIDGSAEICVLSEPYVSKILSLSDEYSSAADLTEEWEKISGTKLVCSCVAAEKNFIAENPDVINDFLMFGEISVNYIKTNKNAGAFLTQLGFFTDADIAAATVPRCNLCFIKGEEMAKLIKDNLSVLFEFSPDSTGGNIPDDGLFFLQ